MASQPSEATTKSGIVTNSSGESHIPSSVRADGSVRKEIRVRPGYRPPEDVEVYKNRTAAAWKTRGSSGVPGADFVESKAQGDTVQKQPKRKKPQSAHTTQVPPPSDQAGTTDVEPSTSPTTQVLDPEAEKQKEAKKLSKKLRQARELEKKKDDGDSLLPEQFEKVIKINELIRQLDRLGFDADGNLRDANPVTR